MNEIVFEKRELKNKEGKTVATVEYKIRDEDALIISELDDDEIEAVKQKLNKNPNVDDFKKAKKERLIELKPKTEADRRAILKKRGYKDEHVDIILSELKKRKLL